MSDRWYRVIIHYREPSYEAQRGHGSRVYRGHYEVEAANAAEAESIAIAAFRDRELESSVGWPRVVTQVDCSSFAAGLVDAGADDGTKDDDHAE